MSTRINYKAVIEDSFIIKNKSGQKQPFLFNDVQNWYYDKLKADYPTLQGIRENDLKGRQQGFSAFIDGIFTVDFIFSTLGKLPTIAGQIISHKKEEVRPLFERVNLYLNSYLEKNNIDRSRFLESDNISNTSMYLKSITGAELYVGTAGAKTVGRGGTLQNLHWSECAFYPDTENQSARQLVTGAEQQVGEGIGKIFRESTGNMEGDFFNEEYELGEQPETDFKSRFFEWWKTKEYRRAIPVNYQYTQREHDISKEFALEDKRKRFGWDDEQYFWYLKKLVSSKVPIEIIREYPCTPQEAFLAQGTRYFSALSLQHYKINLERDPITSSFIYV